MNLRERLTAVPEAYGDDYDAVERIIAAIREAMTSDAAVEAVIDELHNYDLFESDVSLAIIAALDAVAGEEQPETRDQFRSRLLTIAEEAGSNEQASVLVAVYAQALRDVRDMLNSDNPLSDMCMHRGGARDAVESFASERGIDLGVQS